MRSFSCQACGQLVFFENVQCVRCGHALGYLPDADVMSALEAGPDGVWQVLAGEAQGRHYRMCTNYAQENVCNWMVPAEETDTFCAACRLNQTIPDLSVEGNRERWARVEAGKRRLVYALLRLGLPLQDGPAGRLAFAFLADGTGKFQESGEVMTGHADGLITINIAEADDAMREQMRLDMHELYRTVLGHFRHEVGHYYWERLIRPSPRLKPFRQRFGDERADYDEALQRHYHQGPVPNWQESYVSAYATAHPWEDWAETWAHYLHIIDTLDTAAAFELRVRAPEDQSATVTPPPNALYRPQSFDAMIKSWLPLTYALNCVNRSMGQPDLYPFVLSQPALDKLRFVHDVIGDAAQSAPSRGPAGS